MTGQTENSVGLDDRQAILDEIDSLLASRQYIDETRAKRVRKAVDALRGAGAEVDPAAEAPAHDPQLDRQIVNRLEKLRTRIHRQVERRKRNHDRARALMEELEHALGTNELQKAVQAEKTLQSIMGNMQGQPEERWSDIESRLQQARPQLRKLESWRHWGTTQAREELIEQVRQLIGSDQPPNVIARTIQTAREQWQSWDQAGDQPGKELWNKFDQVCEQAYKPCIAHFEQLRAQRSDNLKRRQAIIDRLQERYAATDWKHPDWRELDRFVSQAHRDFRRIGNVDFKQRKPIQKSLETVLEQFENHLARERTRSYHMREKLVTEIEALGSVENLRDALDTLDRLKAQWVITVVEARKLENRLWKRFQAACDGVYRRRDAARQEQQAGRNENLQQKQALIAELTGLADATDAQLLEHGARLTQLQERWQGIGQVPREQDKKLENGWREAQRKYQAALAAARSRARTMELERLAQRAALCSRWEQAALAGTVIDTAAATSEWQALPALSGPAAEAMEQRFHQAHGRADDATLADNLAVKQQACLKLEVLLELASPAECQAERMAYQVARLNATLQKDTGALEAPVDLITALLTTGAIDPVAAASLEQRIAACIAGYIARN
ncbi:MAG: DUF349 domain-containing protein [Pseudomonadota bacterium]